jgi:signal transduction histidine kinase
VWLLFALRERVSLTFEDILINIRISLISINFTAPLWVITILFYTRQLSKKKYWLIPAILSVPFILSIPMVFPASSGIFKLYIEEIYMDEQLRILYENWGPLETVTSISAACCIVTNSWLLLSYFKKTKSVKLFEIITTLFALSSPIIAHFIGLLIGAPFDLTPLAFSLWGVVTIYLSFQRQFFNVLPTLVWNIFDVTKESMVVLDADGSVSINKTFSVVFGPRNNDFLEFADELSAGLSDYIRQKLDVSGLEADKDGIYYEISVKNVLGKKNKLLGQLVTINNVSETKQLTLEKERARIASGLHDSMGNRLIASINNLNLAAIKSTTEESRKYIDSAATSAVASLMTLRKIVEGLSPVDFNEVKLIPLIESVINRISASGVRADLQISGDLEEMPNCLKEFIYNACQEALTNSVIHGKAEIIVVKLEFSTSMLKMDIVDDGRGCEIISKNNGLTAMESRANALGGKIRFGSSVYGGFGIYAEIPFCGLCSFT